MITRPLPQGRSPNNQYKIGSPHLRNNISNRPILHFVSPTSKNTPQSPSMIRKPTSEYITHLIPNQSSQLQSSTFKPQNSSFIKHYFTYNSDNKSNASNSGVHKNNLMNNTGTMSSLGTRSRVISGSQNKKSIFIQHHKNQYCPPTPNNIRKLEPIRRISQHRVNNGSQISVDRSNRSESQHNINIIVETDLSKNPNQMPPKITVSHIHKGASSKGSSLILRNPQNNSLLSNPVFSRAVQKSIHESRPQTDRGQSTPPVIQFMTPVKNSNVQMVPQNVRPPPLPQEKPIVMRRHSLSLDNKNFIKVNQQDSNFIASNDSNLKNENAFVQQVTKNTAVFHQPVSFNRSEDSPIEIINHNTEPISHYQFKQPEIKSQSTERAKQHIFKLSQYEDYQKKSSKQCINEYYGLQGLKEDSIIPSEIDETRKFQMYGCQHKTHNRALINEIFENETHKALLKMEKISSRSQEKTFKKRRY